ncbi:HK97-gp10 family putative phage morphogenesis protein [Solimonas fluminis]|uniref:HK97-gp10 family putative phage morphogenesis protein n=1 Tax=Solimonas fluminis TaxID=2086571 RepID=UPI0010570236|nr:HK97-gp10 family putative phage morphogenesis protein [Solimonas fluminis]
MSGALDGVAQLMRQLEELGLAANGKALRAAVRAGSRPVVKRAKQLIPEGADAHRTYRGRLVTPGFAKRSIRTVTKLSRDKQKASVAIGVRAEAFYATQFVELGTSRQAPQPWLRPAMEQTQQEQLAALGDSLKKTIEKAAKKK